jgi:ATP-dependent helicase/nuclease subunit B
MKVVQEMDDLEPDETVVVPTRRLAHHLRARWNERCATDGLQVWRTPSILTWGELLARMFRLDSEAGRLDRRWLPSVAAEMWWERTVRQDPASRELLAPAGLGRSAYQSWCRLHEYLIPVEALADADGSEGLAFQNWVHTYRDWLTAGAWMDPAEAAAAVSTEAAGTRLRFLGFGSYTPQQQAFLERLRAAQVGVVLVEAPTASRCVGWVSCDDRHTEIEAAARWAARELDGMPGRRLAIVVPDLRLRREQVRRTLERVFVPAETDEDMAASRAGCFDLACARPLAAQPPVAAALGLLQSFVRAEDAASGERLLRSDYCDAAPEESVARARLDARLRSLGRVGVPLSGLASVADQRGCPMLAGLIRRGLDQLADWPSRAPASVWSQRFHQLLGAVGWPGVDLDSREHQGCQRWQGLLAEFGASDDVLGALSRHAALAAMRELAERVLFEPQEQGAPLLVIDPETCVGMSFDGLWICGLDTDHWPGPSAADPFLPRSWQLRRGVPGVSPALAHAAARDRLEALTGSAPEVILSVPAFDRDAPLLPSALLAETPSLAEVPRWPAADAVAAMFDGRPGLERLVDGRMTAWSGSETLRGGARVLELQAACPFRAQAELRLDARPVEDPAPGLDGASRGRLVHDTLAEVWLALGSNAHLAGMPDVERRSLVRGAIDHCFGPRLRDADEVGRALLAIEAAWLELRILELLAADEARSGFEVLHVEQDVVLEIGGLPLRLRPDRVDRLVDGSLAVIDYKTGADAEPRAWAGERPRLPQLPLYLEALGASRVSAVAFGRVRSGGTGYVGVAGSNDGFPGLEVPGGKGALREFASWDELLAAWRERLTALAEEFRSGEARLAFDRSEACRHCPLPALCRVAEIPAGATVGDDE